MTDTTVGSADLDGLSVRDVHYYVSRGALHNCDGGGTGNRYRFPPSELVVARALVGWRAAREGAALRIAEAVRAAVEELPAEDTTTLTVVVRLAAGAWLTLEVER